MKAILITGAAGSVGQALCREIARLGYTVIGVDVVDRPDDLQCDHFIHCDHQRFVKDEVYAANVFAEVEHALAGRSLAGLINNAAIQVLAPVEALDRAAWSTTLEVNLVAPFLWSQGLLSRLEAADGMVVNVSSIHAKLTKPHFVAYATSKAALSAMTRALAVELGVRIRVLAVEPAAIDTPMLKAGFAGLESKLDELRNCHPTGDIAQPAELASLVGTLFKHPGRFLNGMILGFDGGISSRLHDP